jgi:hypothetical protein
MEPTNIKIQGAVNAPFEIPERFVVRRGYYVGRVQCVLV